MARKRSRRRRRASTSTRRFSSVPRRSSGRRRRRGGFAALAANPSFNVKNVAMQGIVAGVGAIGVNMAVNRVASMLPASLSSGTGRALTKAAIGVGLGFAAKKLGQGKYATALAMGGIAVAVLDLAASKLTGMKGIDYGGDRFHQLSGGLADVYQLPDGSVVDAAGNLLSAPTAA